MSQNRRILRQERGGRRTGGGDDEAVEGIACPSEACCHLHDGGETTGVEGESEFRRKIAYDIPARHLQLSDLVQVIEFQENHRRNDRRSLRQQWADEGRKARKLTCGKPDNGVGIEVNQGRHSEDQSR